MTGHPPNGAPSPGRVALVPGLENGPVLGVEPRRVRPRMRLRLNHGYPGASSRSHSRPCSRAVPASAGSTAGARCFGACRRFYLLSLKCNHSASGQCAPDKHAHVAAAAPTNDTALPPVTSYVLVLFVVRPGPRTCTSLFLQFLRLGLGSSRSSGHFLYRSSRRFLPCSRGCLWRAGLCLCWRTRRLASVLQRGQGEGWRW